MPAMAGTNLLPYLSPLRLLGPLADKELRVASRRVWKYALPSSYIVLLCFLTLSAWYSIVGLPDSALGAFGVSRASVVSAYVATGILSFQFVAAQLVAALMLSSSLGDEMRRGTLSVLLTTPITSVHIVAGKLLSGLLQVVLLLVISLPALAVLRAMGGLSWADVCAASCVTLTATIFAASLSLLLSTYCRHSFQAISVGAVVYLVVFVGLPFLATYLFSLGGWGPSVMQPIVNLTNPFQALSRVLPLLRPGAMTKPSSFSAWPLHCLIMAAMAGAILCVSVRRIRQVAGGLLTRARAVEGIRRLQGMPVVWKDDPGGRLWCKRTLLIAGAVLLACVVLGAQNTTQRGTFGPYLYYGWTGLWLVTALRVAISAAGGITREKESGAWQVLLATPLDDRQILWGKVAVALRKNAVLVLSLLALQTCLIWVDSLPEWGLVAGVYALCRLAAVGFILGAGLYFGTRLRTTTVAVAATIVAFLGVNYLLGAGYNPLFSWLWTRFLASLNQGGNSHALVISLAVSMGGGFILDIVLGLYFLRRARRNVRAYVF